MNKLISKILFLFLIAQITFGQISPGELSEAHKKLEGMSNCTNCHVLGKKGSISNKKCLDCHTEIKNLINDSRGFHSSKKVKGKECSDCHGEHFGRDFEIIRFNEDNFNHNITGFELTGKHSELKCAECHSSKFIKDDKLKERKKTFLGLETSCTNCHDDFHQGNLSSNNCVDCHNLTAWRPAKKFNHDNAKFKLVGAHQKISCEKCHAKIKKDGADFQKFTGLKFGKCVDCHEDIHKGKFGTNCTACHTNHSFAKVKNLQSFDHSKTKFILVGKHKTLTCNKCHTKGIKVKLQFDNCTDCHSDFHKGAFEKNGKNTDCKVCHDEHGFTPSNFTIERHANTGFNLTGAHNAVPCTECHFVNNNWKFDFVNTECETCHDNVHKESLEFGNDVVEDCETCHSTNRWDLISFDHNKTGFELIGKHTDVSCSDCHFENENAHQFVDVSEDCESCHIDNHKGQFQEKYKNDCSECHTPLKWTIEKFDHSKTRFVIDGKHKNVTCNECHKEREIDGQIITQYKFEDISCKSCHT